MKNKDFKFQTLNYKHFVLISINVDVNIMLGAGTHSNLISARGIEYEFQCLLSFLYQANIIVL